MPNFDYLPHSQLLELRRWNTPTVYNGWECVTKRNRLDCNCSWEPGLVDFTPQLGPMVGYAVTVEYVCGDAAERAARSDPFGELYDYLASIPGPKILFARDLEYPDSKGSIFGEVTGNAYRALGCVGAITDGSARDVDEAAYGGIKLMARRLCVGHAYSCPVRFGGTASSPSPRMRRRICWRQRASAIRWSAKRPSPPDASARAALHSRSPSG